MSQWSCRVCQSRDVAFAGTVEYLRGFPCAIVDCRSCGCRTSATAPPLHAGLHTVPSLSYYASYRELVSQCQRLFAMGDRDGIERLLRQQRKYAFVLDRLKALPAGARILEWGCSTGYLTSAAVLAGRPILGVDVAPEAIDAARAAFGDHFVLDDSPRIESNGPYDAIYHVGLIGCVADPLGLTRRLVGLLKPNGILFFNAPNRQAMHLRGQLWLDSAPPPDVVTLFPCGFWAARAGAGMTVDENAEMTGPASSTIKTLERWFGRPWRPPSAKTVDAPVIQQWTQPAPGPVWRAVEVVATKISGVAGIGLGRWPDEFGLFVVMTKS